jgi:hypothetical protein
MGEVPAGLLTVLAPGFGCALAARPEAVPSRRRSRPLGRHGGCADRRSISAFSLPPTSTTIVDNQIRVSDPQALLKLPKFATYHENSTEH